MQEHPRNIWVVEQHLLWGDYGDVLVSGYGRREHEKGPVLLHRTGPFLPPISFPWLSAGGHAVIVSDDFRREVEALHLPGVTFREAIKDRIVPLPWHEWDLDAEEPKEYPPEGEPEEYVWDESHDPTCAARMPAAFELVAPLGPIVVKRIENPRGGYLDEFVADGDWAGAPPMFADHPKYGKLIVESTVREWFQERVGAWVRCSPINAGRARLTPR